MLALFAKHSLIAICVAVFLEELGIPMPIPTDLLIIFAGAEGAGSLNRLLLWFILLSLASAAGASGLYAIIRRGGRPLIDRFGRFIHLGPAQLARGEALLTRGGWFGIAVGRALPGVRYVTVIVCGLLRVPYWRFLTAHLVGSAVYIVVFLALGAMFGPTIIDWIHLPAHLGQLLWMLALALGLPLLLAWLYHRAHMLRPANPSRRRQFWAVLLASFIGTASLGGGWASATLLLELLAGEHPLNVASSFMGWLLGQGLSPINAYVAFYTGLIGLCAMLAFSYYELVLPRLAPQGTSLRREVGGLALLSGLLVAATVALALTVLPAGPPRAFWRSSGPLVLLLVLAVGIACFALTTAYGRALALTVLPSLRRSQLALPGTLPPATSPDEADELVEVGREE